MAKTKRTKKRTHVPAGTDPNEKKAPKSFVFWRGKHGAIMKALETDLRRVMEPNTAQKLKESKHNQLRDFVDLAGPLGVTHFLILTATTNAAYLRLAKTPRGPTLTMQVHQYSLMRDVVAAQQRPRMPETMWKNPPLVVMQGFGQSEEMKLATVLFQNLFPAINVQTARLTACQRVVLLSYNAATQRIAFRHYNISTAPSGVTKTLKTLVTRRTLPDLAHLQDVSEYLTKSGFASESEGEEAAEARVVLSQDVGRGKPAQRPSRVRLTEIGPRMELEVVKAEEGLCSGKVLFHRHIHRSGQEAEAQQEGIDEREALRAERRRQQAENVEKKKQAGKRKGLLAQQRAAEEAALSKKAAEKAERRKKREREAEKGEGKPLSREDRAPPAKKAKGERAPKGKKEWWEEEAEVGKGGDPRQRHLKEREAEEAADAAYYRAEVGEEPDETFPRAASQGGFRGGAPRGAGRGGLARGRGGREGRDGGRGEGGREGGGGRGRGGAPRGRGMSRGGGISRGRGRGEGTSRGRGRGDRGGGGRGRGRGAGRGRR